MKAGLFGLLAGFVVIGVRALGFCFNPGQLIPVKHGQLVLTPPVSGNPS